MEYMSRVERFRRMDRNSLVREMEKAADIYDEAVLNAAPSQEAYEKNMAVTLAVLAAEDGHYYETEHLYMSRLMDADVVRQMRYMINDIIQTDNLAGAVLAVQSVFDRFRLPEPVWAAIDLAACYFFLTGGLTPSRQKLLKDLFGSY